MMHHLWFGIFLQGWFAGAGSGNHTSPAYPARCPFLRLLQELCIDNFSSSCIDKVNIETLEPSTYPLPNPSCSYDSNSFAFQVVSVCSNSCNILNYHLELVCKQDYNFDPKPRYALPPVPAILTTLLHVISSTVTLWVAAAAKSIWSEPTPAVRISRSFGAFVSLCFVI